MNMNVAELSPDVMAATRHLDDRIVLAVSLAVQEVVARLVAVHEAERSRPPDSPAPAAPPPPRSLHFGGFTLDVSESRLVAPGGALVALPGLEFRLLRAFVLHPRQVMSRATLVQMTRHEGIDYPSERTIAVYIARLRKRLGTGGGSLISTVRHAGYVLDVDVIQA